jgi:hypothetical protein
MDLKDHDVVVLEAFPETWTVSAASHNHALLLWLHENYVDLHRLVRNLHRAMHVGTWCDGHMVAWRVRLEPLTVVRSVEVE